jgi:hypothetical protein
MKKQLFFAIGLLTAITVTSCKTNSDPEVGLSEEIQKIVPTSILDDLRAKGMAVNEGRTPPKLNGVYFVNPLELLSPYSTSDPFNKGKIIAGYKYTFSKQSSDGKTVTMDYSQQTDRGEGIGSFVSGSGNKFTIFAEMKGVSSGVNYITLKVISGELTNTGEIKNFQLSLYLTSKSENEGRNSILMPVKTGRIWFDNDFMTEKLSGARLPAPSTHSNAQASAVGVSK